MSDHYQERYLAHQRRKAKVLSRLIRERHSDRVFGDSDPHPEDLGAVLRAGDLAASSCDRHGVTTRLVRDRDEKAILSGLLVGGVGWLHRAPVVLLLFGDPLAYKAGDEATYMPFLDAGTMVGQMQLAATALGLHSCFVNPNIRPHNREHFHKLFGPGIYCGALALGLPPEE